MHSIVGVRTRPRDPIHDAGRHLDFMNNTWLVPTVIVTASGVVVQGIKAAWDLAMSIKGHANSLNALRLQEVGALMNLVDGLPLGAAQKALGKARLVRLIERKAPMSEVYAVLDDLIREGVGPLQ